MTDSKTTDWALLLTLVPLYGFFVSICYLGTFWYASFGVNPLQFADLSNVIFTTVIPIFTATANVVVWQFFYTLNQKTFDKNQISQPKNAAKIGPRIDPAFTTLLKETRQKIDSAIIEPSSYNSDEIEATIQILEQTQAEHTSAINKFNRGLARYMIVGTFSIWMVFQNWFVFDYIFLSTVAHFLAEKTRVATTKDSNSWYEPLYFLLWLVPMMSLSSGLEHGSNIRRGIDYKYIIAANLKPIPEGIKRTDEIKFLGVLGHQYFYTTQSNAPLIVTDENTNVGFILYTKEHPPFSFMSRH